MYSSISLCIHEKHKGTTTSISLYNELCGLYYCIVKAVKMLLSLLVLACFSIIPSWC